MKHQQLFATRQLTFQELLKQQVFDISNIGASMQKKRNVGINIKLERRR